MFLFLLFFFPFPFLLSSPSSSRVSQREVFTSAFCFVLCVCAAAALFARLFVSGARARCVGVGDKAVLQHHCVYKAPVCCLLLLITAQHNVSAQLAMHKIVCAHVCVCVCVSEREERRGERRVGGQRRFVGVQSGKDEKNEKWNFIRKSICFSLIALEHPFPIRKFPPKRGEEGN